MMHPHTIAWALGLRRCCSYCVLQFFVQLLVWIDGDGSRLAWRDGNIGAQARANASRLLIGFGLNGIVATP
jgi:hypothetical protein